ncbi:MAG TPA: DUF6152 family protein [Pyrinomonadaceae bacterium]
MKISVLTARVVLGFALTFGVLPLGRVNVEAHHGGADYDKSRSVTVSGVIVEAKYANPHCEARVRADGNVWFIELSAVWRMQRRGVTAAMIKPGTTVTLTGYPHKKKPHEMKAMKLTVDGKTYELV